MEKKYWLNRISYHSELSYDLLEKGYLTIGWSMFLDKPDEIIDTIKEQESDTDFRNYTESYGVKSTSRWSLWNFGKMKKSDIVLVPMYDSKFGVYRIKEEIQPISKMKLNNFIASNKEEYEISGSYLIKSSTKEIVDLGFFIEVESILEHTDSKPRDHAEAELRNRMKIRQTNADITDLAKQVDNAIHAEKPHDAYSIFIKEMQNKFIEDKIFLKYTADQVELIVAQYFKSIGADEVKVLAKNDPKKAEGSDADVEAKFTDLWTNYYVQVKNHEDETGIHGLEQIKSYMDNIKNIHDDKNEVNIGWFLTTAVFAEEVKQKANEYNIRLIDGKEFVEMIFNAGIDVLDLEESKLCIKIETIKRAD